MDTSHVTNDQFAQFVKESNYRTTAEQIPDWDTLKVQLPPGTPQPPAATFSPSAMVLLALKIKWTSMIAHSGGPLSLAPIENILRDLKVALQAKVTIL